MKRKYTVTCIIGVLLIAVFAFVASSKITYLENPDFSSKKEGLIEIKTKGTVIEERLTMPFDLVKACTVHVSNYGRDNNSRWEFVLQDASGKTVVRKRFNFTGAADGEFYRIVFDRTARVKKGETYIIKIKALNINDANQIAFSMDYTGSRYAEGAQLFVDGQKLEGTLCLTMQGGDVDFFWVRLAVLLGSLVLFGVLRGMYLAENGKKWRQDPVLRAMMTGGIVFMLYLPYADPKVGLTLIDETDNICGGMLIAGGKVLYRDYVTQHTPFAYYLCAVYALLGASSVEQMRILFYLTLGVAWAGIYARYHKTNGDKVMIWISTMVTLCSEVLIGITASMIMSDLIQEVCMVLLLLEFRQYQKDRKLGWDRAAVISLGVWVAFSSAFMSAYSIGILGIGFLVIEIRQWHRVGWRFKEGLRRYIPLTVCSVIPPTAGVIYFTVNHALYQCYRQAYLFNREVYPNYQEVGGSLISPFLTGMASMFEDFVNSFLAVSTSGLTVYHILFVGLVGAYLFTVIRKIIVQQESIVYWGFMMLLICAGAGRGVGNTHGLAFWGMLIAVVVMAAGETLGAERRNWQISIYAVLSGILLQPYVSAIVQNITTEQYVVNSEERYLVEETEEGEEIFINAFSFSPLYLIAKGHYPANRAAYVLPWYMDWYEEWELEDLEEKQPAVVVWNPDQEIWGWSYFCNELNDYINANYTRGGATSFIWRRNG